MWVFLIFGWGAEKGCRIVRIVTELGFYISGNITVFSITHNYFSAEAGYRAIRVGYLER
jgi:hypothetical protein